MEDRFDTDIDDLWSALTDPARLGRWLGQVEGDLRLGGEFRARFFASGWEGTGRVEACEPPRRLLVRTRGRWGQLHPAYEGSRRRSTDNCCGRRVGAPGDVRRRTHRLIRSFLPGR
jgi:uncharacterized protein YndB with AHSA1/START domain